MKRTAVLLGLVIALAWSLSSTLQGQELQEGTWSGSWVRVGGTPGEVPQPRSVSLEVKKIPDPHWRWRSGKGELLNVTFLTPQPPVRAQASDLRLENGALSYSFVNSQSDKMNCHLDLRKDGTYEGNCVGETGTPRFRLTLTPPTKDSK